MLRAKMKALNVGAPVDTIGSQDFSTDAFMTLPRSARSGGAGTHPTGASPIARPTRPIWKGAPPVAGYRAWYDAADQSTLTISSNTITTWTDKTGSYNATGAGSTKPGYGGSTSIRINGILVPYFGGTTNSTYFTTSLDDSTRTRTVFLVMRSTRTSTTGGQTGIGSSLNGGFHFQIGGPGGYMNVNSNQISGFAGGKIRHFIATPQVIVARMSSTEIYFWRNQQKSALTSNSGTFTASRTTWIGATYVGGSAAEVFSGGIGEIIDYGSTLTDAEVGSVVLYLMAKWGIS